MTMTERKISKSPAAFLPSLWVKHWTLVLELNVKMMFLVTDLTVKGINEAPEVTTQIPDNNDNFIQICFSAKRKQKTLAFKILANAKVIHGVHNVFTSQQEPHSVNKAVGREPKKSIAQDFPLYLCILGVCQDECLFSCVYLEDFVMLNNTGLHTAY